MFGLIKTQHGAKKVKAVGKNKQHKHITDYKHIIWDWNGTLIDDVDIVIEAMNTLLKRRNLPLLDIDTYRDIFTFPVQDYYARLGFDFAAEPFEKLAAEYIAEITSGKYAYKMFSEAACVLEKVRSLGIKQSVLSASEQTHLQKMVDDFGVSAYFSAVSGLNNHYARSKVEAGKQTLASLNLKPDEIILVGDTTHDFEVASALGCDCLLVANGHQSYKRLKPLKTQIVGSLAEFSSLLT